MKLAIAGKGGSGKTTVAGTMARLAARRGIDVLAIDADLNPNLAFALGVAPEAFQQITPLPPDLLQRRQHDGETRLELIRPVDELVEQHAFDCPDGVRILLMGRPNEAGMGCLCHEHATVRGVLRELPASSDLVIVDMEASPEHLARATPEGADAMLIVAEPYFRSLETARRQAVLANDLGIDRVVVLANKVRSSADGEAIGSFCDRHGIEVAGTVPYDERLGEAERAGVAPVDHDVHAPSVTAIDELIGEMVHTVP